MGEVIRGRFGRQPRSPYLLRYMFPGLLPPVREPAAPELTGEQVRWSVRGEPRTRATFGQPHPGDFPGGLPLPGDYPDIS